MKRLTITVLVAGLFAGSLFASENNTMMGMDKEKCMAMYDADGKFIGEVKQEEVKQEVSTKVVMENNDGKVKATVTKSVNGVSTSEVIEGTEAEVKAKVDALK